MTPIQSLDTVESAARKVSRQLVKVKVEGHQIHTGNWLRRHVLTAFGPSFYAHFISETNFPMKIVSGRFGQNKGNFEFVQVVQPHVSHPQRAVSFTDFLGTGFFTGSYITLYLNGIVSPDMAPPADDVRVMEFALSLGLLPPIFNRKIINIEDKTSNEFTGGKDTYKKMNSSETKTLYWFDKGTHFMARGEIVTQYFIIDIWLSIIQEFDPLTEED